MLGLSCLSCCAEAYENLNLYCVLLCVNLNVLEYLKVLGYAALHMLPFGTPAARITFVSVLCSAGATALIYFTTAHLFCAVVEKEVTDSFNARNATSERALPASAHGASNTPENQSSGEQVELEMKCITWDLVAACRAAGFAGAGLYAFSPLVWMYSTQAEVFALNNLFVAVLVFLTTLYLVPGAREEKLQTESELQIHSEGAERSTDAGETNLKRQGMRKDDRTDGGSVRSDGSDTQTRVAHVGGGVGTRQLSEADSRAAQGGGQPERMEETLEQVLRDVGLREHRLLVSPSAHEQAAGNALGGFYWSTEDAESCEVLLIVIPGSGSSLAGLWSSARLCAEHGLQVASVAPYVRSARRLGWGVLLMCPNMNFEHDASCSQHEGAEAGGGCEEMVPGDAVSKSAEHVQDGGVVKCRPHKPRARALRRAALAGSETADVHAVSVWVQIVRPTSAKVAVVAYSTGGTAALHVASTFPDEFARRVFGLALLGERPSALSPALSQPAR